MLAVIEQTWWQINAPYITPVITAVLVLGVQRLLQFSGQSWDRKKLAYDLFVKVQLERIRQLDHILEAIDRLRICADPWKIEEARVLRGTQPEDPEPDVRAEPEFHRLKGEYQTAVQDVMRKCHDYGILPNRFHWAESRLDAALQKLLKVLASVRRNPRPSEPKTDPGSKASFAVTLFRHFCMDVREEEIRQLRDAMPSKHGSPFREPDAEERSGPRFLEFYYQDKTHQEPEKLKARQWRWPRLY